VADHAVVITAEQDAAGTNGSTMRRVHSSLKNIGEVVEGE